MRCVLEGKSVDQDIAGKLNPDVQAIFNKAGNSNTMVEISDLNKAIGENKVNKADNANGNVKSSKTYFR